MINILDYNNICNTSSSLEVVLIIKNTWNLIKVVVPAALVIFSMIDGVKMVSSSSEDKISQSGKILKRMFSAAAVFLIGIVVDFALNLLGESNLFASQCWNDATKEMVEAKAHAEEEARKSEEASRNKKLQEKQKKAYQDSLNKNKDKLPDSTPGGYHSSTSTGGDSDVVEYAKQFIGSPYVFAGPRGVDDPDAIRKGTDCSGYLSIVYKHFGMDIGTNTNSICVNGKEVSLSNIQPGDILCISDSSGGYSHVVMYVGLLSNGEGKSCNLADGTDAVIHASNSAPFPSGGVKFSSLQSYTKATTIRRFTS